MKVSMTAWIPGTRPGGAWPAPGEEVEVSDAEGAGLVASGLAVLVAAVSNRNSRPADKKPTKRATKKATKK